MLQDVWYWSPLSEDRESRRTCGSEPLRALRRSMPCVALLQFCVLGSFRAYCVRIQGRYSSIVAAGKANRSPDKLRAGGKQSARPPDAPRPGCMTAGGANVEASEKDFVHVTELSTPQLQRHLRIRRQPVRRRQPLDYHQCGGCDQTRIAALLTRNNTARSAATCSATDRPGCRTSLSPSASARSRPAWPAARTSRMAAPKPGRRRRTQAIPRSWRFRCRRRSWQFQTEVPKPSPNALYTLSIGSNDVLDILASPGLTAQQQTTDVDDAVANEIAFVKQLVTDGAKNLLVLGVPDIGKAPNVMEGLANGSDTPSAALDTEASQLASAYNTDLTSQLATIASADTVDVHVIDTYQLIDNAVANPAAYGLTNVTSPVWTRQLHQRQQRHTRNEQRRRTRPVLVLGFIAPDRDRPSGDRRPGRGATQRHARPDGRGYHDGSAGDGIGNTLHRTGKRPGAAVYQYHDR